MRLQREDLLLDGVGRDVPVDEDRLVLPDPVHPVDGLLLGSGVPPRVEDEDVVGLGQGEAEPPGLQRDEEDRRLSLPEVADHARPVGRAPVEVCGCQALCMEPLLGHPQKPREGREDQSPVPFCRELTNLVHEGVELRRRGPFAVLLLHQAGVQCHLSQRRQRGQDRHPVLVRVLGQQAQDPLTLPLQVLLVDPLVGRGHGHRDHLHLLLGQLGRHDRLRPAQHEGSDPAPQPGQRQLVAALDRPAVARDEGVHLGEEPRRGEREERPQVHEGVLHRCPRDGYHAVGLEAAQHEVGLRAGILDELRLVTDEEGPALLPQVVGVDPRHGVGGDDDVRTGDPLGERLPRLAGGLAEDDDTQVRGEPGRLTCPGGEHRGRGDDEDRALQTVLLLEAKHRSEGLQGLPQSHVVGEDPAETRVEKVAEPGEAGLLVGPQLGPQPARYGHRAGRLSSVRVGSRQLGEPARRLDPRGRSEVVDGQVDEVVDVGDTVPVHPEHRRPVRVAQVLGLLDELDEAPQGRLVETEPDPGGQDHDVVTAHEGGEDVGEGHLLTIDGHRDPQREPVPHLLDRRDLDARLVSGLLESRHGAGLLHEDVGVCAQLGQHEGHDLDEVGAEDGGASGQHPPPAPVPPGEPRHGVEDLEALDQLLLRGVVPHRVPPGMRGEPLQVLTAAVGDGRDDVETEPTGRREEEVDEGPPDLDLVLRLGLERAKGAVEIPHVDDGGDFREIAGDELVDLVSRDLEGHRSRKHLRHPPGDRGAHRREDPGLLGGGQRPHCRAPRTHGSHQEQTVDRLADRDDAPPLVHGSGVPHDGHGHPGRAVRLAPHVTDDVESIGKLHRLCRIRRLELDPGPAAGREHGPHTRPEPPQVHRARSLEAQHG